MPATSVETTQTTESTAESVTAATTRSGYPLRRIRLGRRNPAGQPRAANLVLALILTCQLMVVLDATIVNIALPDIRADLGFSAAGLSWVVNAYTLTFGGLLLLGARAGDILGRRRVFLAGIGLFTLASLAGGFAQNPGQLLAARAAQGIGGALASPTALALLMTMFTGARERTRAIGLYTAVSIGGAAIGLVAGGMLSEWASWRWVLFVNVPIGVVLLLAAIPSLPETPGLKGRFDVTGAVTSTLGMGGLVYGFVHAASDGWSNPMTIGAFVLGVALLIGFVVTEARVEAPITPLRLFADRVRASSYVARLLLVAGMMGMFFFLTQFLHGVLGYSDLRTGFAFLPMPLMVFAASQLAARRLIDRFGNRPLMITGIAMSTVGMIWLTQLDETSGYGALLGPLMVFAFGNGLAFVPLTTASLDGVEPQDSGAASGMVNVMQQVGGSLGLAVLVTVFGAASRHAQHDLPAGLGQAQAAKRVFVEASQTSFWMAALFLAATLLLITVAMRPRAARHSA